MLNMDPLLHCCLICLPCSCQFACPMSLALDNTPAPLLTPSDSAPVTPHKQHNSASVLSLDNCDSSNNDLNTKKARFTHLTACLYTPMSKLWTLMTLMILCKKFKSIKVIASHQKVMTFW